MATTFRPLSNPSSFRALAAAMWRAPNNPSIYGALDLDVTDTNAYIERFRRETGRKLTITHVVIRAVAHILQKHPELNMKVRFGGRFEQRDNVDVFVSVAADGGKDLSGVRIPDADTLSLARVVDAVEAGAKGVRTGADATYQRSRNLFRRIPFFLARWLVRATDILTNELHVDLPEQGMPVDPFGSAIITNVGTFGIDLAFAPLVPLSRAPMLFLLSEVKLRPVVVGEQLEVRPTLRISATFDHRVIDGFQAGVIARELRELVEHPTEEIVPTLRKRASTGARETKIAKAVSV